MRTISLLTATCIVVANMVGTGIFTSLGFQVGDLPTGFAIMALWAIGGVCALCGALSYAELGAALPRSGGEYHFLREVYHPAVGFVAGWLRNGRLRCAGGDRGDPVRHLCRRRCPGLNPLSVVRCNFYHDPGVAWDLRLGSGSECFDPLKVGLILVIVAVGST